MPDPIAIATVVEDEVHVYPLFGREHQLVNTCWCQPERDTQEAAMLVHHPEQ